MKKLLLAAVVLPVALVSFAAPKAAEKVLKTGRYHATITALACEACAGEVETTMKGFDELEKVSVDQKSSSVSFSVKKGAKVAVAKLQKRLKDASDRMGMGADYTLKDLKPVKG